MFLQSGMKKCTRMFTALLFILAKKVDNINIHQDIIDKFHWNTNGI